MDHSNLWRETTEALTRFEEAETTAEQARSAYHELIRRLNTSGVWILASSDMVSDPLMSFRPSSHHPDRQRPKAMAAVPRAAMKVPPAGVDRVLRARRVFSITVVALLILLGTGCTSESDADTTRDGEVAPFEWVAVLEHAESPNDRDFEGQASIIADNSDLELGEELVVSPVACWDGLQEDLGLPSGSYVIAVVGQTRQEVVGYGEVAGYETEPSERPSMCQD